MAELSASKTKVAHGGKSVLSRLAHMSCSGHQLWSHEDQELKTIEDGEALLRELGMSEAVIDAQLTEPDRPG